MHKKLSLVLLLSSCGLFVEIEGIDQDALDECGEPPQMLNGALFWRVSDATGMPIYWVAENDTTWLACCDDVWRRVCQKR